MAIPVLLSAKIPRLSARVLSVIEAVGLSFGAACALGTNPKNNNPIIIK
jgi:hypothetical protein